VERSSSSLAVSVAWVASDFSRRRVLDRLLVIQMGLSSLGLVGSTSLVLVLR
jgi:hypothetical protein